MMIPQVEVVVTYRCPTCGQVWSELPLGGACCRERDGGGQVLTISQVADRLQVSASTVRNWTTSGRLPTVRVDSVVRVTERALDEFVREAERG